MMVEIPTIVWIGLLIVLLRALHKYIFEPYKYWKIRGVPSVPTTPIVGSSLRTFAGHFHTVTHERYKKYGRLYGLYEGRSPALSVGDPELVRNILTKDFQFFPNRRVLKTNDSLAENMLTIAVGEKWKRIRTIVTPSFTTGKIKRMFSIFLDASESLSNVFDKSAKSGEPIDMKRHFGAFTMDVIASTAFGTKIDSHNQPDNPFIKSARQIFAIRFPWRLILLFMFPTLFKLSGLAVFPYEPVNFLNKATLEIIKERRRTGKVRNDFLQLLMDSSEEVLFDESGAVIEQKEADAQVTAPEAKTDQISQSKVYKGLNKDEILAQCVIFFLAGHETTASTLSFVSYLLALNPECQEKLIEEIDDALTQNDNKLSYEAIQNMKYMDNVISETLRMFSPVSVLERVAAADYKLGDTGIIIPKGMLVTVPVRGLHFDPEFYPNPEKFDPHRFTAEEKAKRNLYVYLPFGTGPRNCIGMRFAMTEIKVCLSYIFSKYRVKRCSQTKAPLEFQKGSILLQPKEVVLQIEKRDDSVWNG